MHSDFIAVQGALTGQEAQFAVLELRGDQARVTPTVAAELLYAQLNERFRESWSLSWSVESVSPPIVRCRLEFLGHAREGLGVAHDLAGARGVALTEAARAWQLLPATYGTEDAWVEYDPEDGPNTSELGAPDTDEGPAARPVHQSEPPRDPQMEKAKKHIDDLMDQLREQGLGKQASLVLVRHGGYGQSVEESRRVYAELKALQKG
ncbi:hypothetical protein [Deinococcus peraridilitoris]|uniref:Uncharacterized protein n=1 Tax=Deinococcus peraridilitoris (strain DSM 19664 / LMG 22246 / CIP 109416 / KR-200) TaxID=937777 RepID=L0A3E9_DEIPD|nr:hypothetical protein [Deinococcus peraridilitoris]AFZ68423.1 hypothetical protein Deipe_2968 [Deinococcus peraridilitoris DSM 19664]